MKRVLTPILVLVAFATVAFAAGHLGPEVINLSEKHPAAKKVEEFPHQLHQTKLAELNGVAVDATCTSCHADAKGGGGLVKMDGSAFTPEGKGLKTTWHEEFCWACHNETWPKAGKKFNKMKCNTCHK